MSVCHETNHKVSSRNTCRKIGSNAFEKKKRSCWFFACNGKAEEAKKIVKLRLGWKLSSQAPNATRRKTRYHSRWTTAWEDQQISGLTSLLSRKRWTCGKFTNYVLLGCSSARTKAVCLTKLIMSSISDKGKKQGVRDKSCISLTFELSVAVTRQPQGFLVFSVCIRETRILN